MKSRYYADWSKYVLFSKKFGPRIAIDKAGDQSVDISASIFGMRITPEKCWTPFCEKVFRREKANSVCLPNIHYAPGNSIGFVNDLPGCTRLTIERGKSVDLSSLKSNQCLEELELGHEARVKEFDLSGLPNLIRCSIPVIPRLMSIRECKGLVSLSLLRGAHDGILSLEGLTRLEELICGAVRKLKGVVLNPKVKLRALELLRMKDFETIEPKSAITSELRVVKLDKMRRMNLEWLADAKTVECISLWTEVPSINYLRGLKKLHTLDLFGGKVLDQDFSFRDSLSNKPSRELWDRG